MRDDTSEGAAPDVFLMAEAPWPSAEGYRVAWILSSAKAAKDAEARRARIAAASRSLEDLAARLRGPKARIRSIEGADGAVKKILAETGTEAFFSVHLKASTETTLRRLEPKEGSGAEGRYRRIDRTRIELPGKSTPPWWRPRPPRMGCFPSSPTAPRCLWPSSSPITDISLAWSVGIGT